MRQQQWAGLFEVLAVTLLGLALSIFGPSLTGFALQNPLAGLRPEALPASWLPLVAPAAKLLIVQYASMFAVAGLAMALLWRGPRSLGITRAGQPALRLFGYAVAGAVVVFLPVRGLMEAGRYFDWAPAGPPWREALLSAPLTWDFYAFMAVLSYGLVPVVEEIFYRGYVQGRLQQVMGRTPMPLILTSMLFTLLHSQYLGVHAFGVLTLILLFCLSITLGLLFQQTGSLIPSMLVHGFINLPMSTEVVIGIGLTLIVIAIVWREPVARWWTGALAGFRRPHFDLRYMVALLIVSATALLIPLAPLWALSLGPAYLLALVVLVAWNRRSRASA